MIKYLRLLLCFTCCCFFQASLFAQEEVDTVELNLAEDISERSSDSKSDSEDLGFIFRPKLSLGVGMFTFYGDVNTNHNGFHPTVSKIAYELRLINPLTDYLDLNFYALFGQVSANERTIERSLNFNSNITTGGLTFTYNFKNFRNWKSNVNPYISAGIESVEFLSKSDLRDKDGNYYYYWSNGTIMNMPEDDPNASAAVQLYRDYTYESDLRELNLDGYAKYPERSFAFPVEVGANFKLGERVDFRVSTAMHFTLTDLIDNVTSESIGVRAGTKGNDKFLYTSFSFVYDLTFGNEKGNGRNSGYDGDWMDLYAQDTSDYDKDGVGDLADLCAKTPLDARPVDEFGCPLDQDKDGVSDNKDDELDTPENAPVNELGVALTDDDFFLMYRMYKDSIGEFAVMTEAVNISESGGATGPRDENGLVMSSAPKESYTVIIGSDSTGVSANELHKFLSYKDFKVIDDGDKVYYIVGEFDNINDAMAANDNIRKEGFDSHVGKTSTDDKGNQSVTEVDDSQLPTNNDVASNVTVTKEKLYKIQIGAFKKKLSGNVFGDADDLTYVKGDDGLWRYYSGTFTSKENAAKHRIDLLQQGYKGSFIVAFQEGSRLTLNEAGYDVNPNYNDTKVETSVPTANAVNPELIKFKVQVGAFQNKIPTEILDLYLSIGNVVPRKDASTGLTKYFIGTLDSYQEANGLKKELKEKGLIDAFIVGDFNGKIITAQEALDLLK